jgi:hypothetical protein
MSDLLASERTLEQTSQGGQSERASEQPQEATGGQTSDNGQAAQENIRKLQSTYDKQISGYKQQLAQSQQYIQQIQMQMRDAERNAAPDDYAKLEVDLRHERAEKMAYAQQLQAIQAAQQNEQGLREAVLDIVEDFELLTADEVVEAAKRSGVDNYKAAYKLAAKLQREKEQRKQQRDDDKRERNMPDLGGGAPTTGSTKWDAEYADARQRRDSAAMMRLLNERPKKP